MRLEFPPGVFQAHQMFKKLENKLVLRAKRHGFTLSVSSTNSCANNCGHCGHRTFDFFLANIKSGREKLNPLLQPQFVMHDVSERKIETTMRGQVQGTSVLDGFGILPFEVVSKNIALRPCVQKSKESKFLPKM